MVDAVYTSLETIQAAANDLINEMEIHLLELQQQREAQQEQQPKEQEAAYQLDNGNTLFVQTTETGYDYTLYGPDFKALDGRQLDNPDLSLLEARDEILADLEAQVLVTDILASDALATFQEAAEQANAIPAPAQAEEEPAPALDPAAEPVVTVIWSESPHLKDGQQMPLHEADALFARLDAEYPENMGYDKTKFHIDCIFQGEPDSYEGRQDFGDRDGSLIEHIQSYHEFYAQDEHWKNHVLSTEQNENMIDGIINNTPPEPQPEEPEQLSFEDVTAGSGQTQEETPGAEPTQTAIRYYPINEGAARRAKEAISFSDYRPGSATAEYRHYVDQAVEIAERQKKRVEPEYHEKIDQLLDTYGVYAMINKDERRDVSIRKPRPSIRKQLADSKQATSPKKAAARTKKNELEV